jgi:hypothetical protein
VLPSGPKMTMIRIMAYVFRCKPGEDFMLEARQ